MIQPLAMTLRRQLRRGLPVLLAGLALLAQPVVAEDIGSDRRSGYVLFAADGDSVTMSGSTSDIRRAKAQRAGREALLYVRRGDAAWVVRDAATLREAVAVFQPQQAMGARQAELGSRQAALGARQAALGAQQGRLGAQQAMASEARSNELDRQQDALGRQQDELGRQQDALGRQQDALGREQDRLGRAADAKFAALFDEAVRRGVAKRVD